MRSTLAFGAVGAALVIAIAAYIRHPLPGCDTVEAAGLLRLTRSGVDTVRARFCYAADCRLIADQMNKVEQARWHCE